MTASRNILLYSVIWCPHCVAIKKFLDDNDISYKDHDVEANDEDWHDAMKLAGGQDIVPVINIDGKALFGAFNANFEKQLRQLLGIR